jgi:AcrR family transcriptional regulator
VSPQPVCSVCTSPHRDEVDKAAATGGESLRSIAARLGLNRSAVQRHAKNHLPEYLVGAERDTSVATAILLEIIDASRQVLRAAIREGKDERVLRAADRLHKHAELLLKKTGAVRDWSTVNVNFGGDAEAAVRMVVAELERRGYQVIAPGEVIEAKVLPPVREEPS